MGQKGDRELSVGGYLSPTVPMAETGRQRPGIIRWVSHGQRREPGEKKVLTQVADPKGSTEMRFRGTELGCAGNTRKAEVSGMARNKSGAATVAARATEGLPSLFKGPREGWTRQRHGSRLCQASRR